MFDTETGEYIRTEILQKPNKYARDLWDTGKDPFMATFLELLNVGIMGHCKHGTFGLCVKAGVECYQDGLHANKPNMSLVDFKEIVELVNSGVKTNVHYVLSKSTVGEALERLKASALNIGENIEREFAPCKKEKNGAVDKNDKDIERTEKVQGFGEGINEHDFPFKIGFDSCTVPALLSFDKVNVDAIDTCEGGRWSAYISADMKMMPCSFNNQKERWAVSLREKTLQEVWDSEQFADFRSHFKKTLSGV